MCTQDRSGAALVGARGTSWSHRIGIEASAPEASVPEAETALNKHRMNVAVSVFSLSITSIFCQRERLLSDLSALSVCR